MGKTLILAEKPSVGRDIARALGVKGNAAGEGMIENEEYVVSWAIGHLVALCDPDELNPEWKKWRMETLPMLPEKLETKVLPKTKKQFSILKKLLNSKEVDRVVCATDSGRGRADLPLYLSSGWLPEAGRPAVDFLHDRRRHPGRVCLHEALLGLRRAV